MRKYSFILFFWITSCLSASFCYSQKGEVFLKHYENLVSGSSNEIFSIAQGWNGILYFSHPQGVISYDGVKWETIATPSSPISIKSDTSGAVFVACGNSLGYILTNELGKERFIPIETGRHKPADVYNLLLTTKDVYFYSEKKIYVVSREKRKLRQIIEARAANPFKGIISHNDQVFIKLKNNGLVEYRNNKLYRTLSEKEQYLPEILFAIRYDKKNSLIGTSSNDLFLFDGRKFYPYFIQDQAYLKENTLFSALHLNDKRFALTTLSGGCLVIDKKTHKTSHLINYQTGLPDDEILSIEKDHHGGIWMGHPSGVTRADLQLPVKDYSYYTGLAGSLTDVLELDEKLYIGTTEGLFTLTEVSDQQEFEQIITFHEQNKDRRSARSSKGSFHLFHSMFRKKKKQEDVEEEKERKRYFSFKKKDAQGEKENVIARSFGYVYKPIEGISGRCFNVLEYKGKIIALTSGGLFEVRGMKAEKVFDITHPNTIYYSKDRSFLLIGYKGGVERVEFRDWNWTHKKIKYINEDVYSIQEDIHGDLWFGTKDKALRVNYAKGQSPAIQSFPLDAGHLNHIRIFELQRELCFLLPDGIAFYDKESNKISPYQHLKHLKKLSYICKQKDYVWFLSDTGYVGLSSWYNRDHWHVPYLSLFKGISNIFTDRDKNLWIIDEKSKLVKLESDSKTGDEALNFFVRSITNDEGKTLAFENLSFDHTNNTLHFHLAAPHYIDESNLKFQYYLHGASEQWSEWKKNGIISFSLLPWGKYKLHLRAKNDLGYVSSEKVLEFEILPPYWKRPWFYLLEILFLLSLLVLSIVLKTLKENHFISRSLTFLTLIIFTEFCNTCINSFINFGFTPNPIIGFSINVLLALLISPVERFLRWIISRKRKQIMSFFVQSTRMLVPGFLTRGNGG